MTFHGYTIEMMAEAVVIRHIRHIGKSPNRVALVGQDEDFISMLRQNFEDVDLNDTESEFVRSIKNVCAVIREPPLSFRERVCRYAFENTERIWRSYVERVQTVFGPLETAVERYMAAAAMYDSSLPKTPIQLARLLEPLIDSEHSSAVNYDDALTWLRYGIVKSGAFLLAWANNLDGIDVYPSEYVNHYNAMRLELMRQHAREQAIRATVEQVLEGVNLRLRVIDGEDPARAITNTLTDYVEKFADAVSRVLEQYDKPEQLVRMFNENHEKASRSTFTGLLVAYITD